jgi:hypothetical protein
VAVKLSYKNRRPILTLPRYEREIEGLLLTEVALETAKDGGWPISTSRLSRFERNPKQYPLTEVEDQRRRAAIRRLSGRTQNVTPSTDARHTQGVEERRGGTDVHEI